MNTGAQEGNSSLSQSEKEKISELEKLLEEKEKELAKREHAYHLLSVQVRWHEQHSNQSSPRKPISVKLRDSPLSKTQMVHPAWKWKYLNLRERVLSGAIPIVSTNRQRTRVARLLDSPQMTVPPARGRNVFSTPPDKGIAPRTIGSAGPERYKYGATAGKRPQSAPSMRKRKGREIIAPQEAPTSPLHENSVQNEEKPADEAAVGVPMPRLKLNENEKPSKTDRPQSARTPKNSPRPEWVNVGSVYDSGMSPRNRQTDFGFKVKHANLSPYDTPVIPLSDPRRKKKKSDGTKPAVAEEKVHFVPTPPQSAPDRSAPTLERRIREAEKSGGLLVPKPPSSDQPVPEERSPRRLVFHKEVDIVESEKNGVEVPKEEEEKEVEVPKDVEDESKENEEKEVEVPKEAEDEERKMHRRRSRKSLHGEGEEKEEGEGHHHRYHRRRSRKNLHDEEGEDGDGERKMHRRRSRKSLHGEEEEKEAEVSKDVGDESKEIEEKEVEVPKETEDEEKKERKMHRRRSRKSLHGEGEEKEEGEGHHHRYHRRRSRKNLHDEEGEDGDGERKMHRRRSRKSLHGEEEEKEAEVPKDVEDESKEIEEKEVEVPKEAEEEEKKVDTTIESEEKEVEVPKDAEEEEKKERKMHRRRSRKSLHGEGEEKDEGEGHHHRYHRRRSRKNLHDEEGEDGDGERKMHRRRSRKSLHGEEEEKEAEVSKDVEEKEKKVDTIIESEEKEVEVPKDVEDESKENEEKNEEKEVEVPKDAEEEEKKERKMHRRRSRKSLHGEGEEKEEGEGHHHRYHRRRSRKNLHDEEGEDGDGERKMHRRRSRKSLHGEEEEKEAEVPKDVEDESKENEEKKVEVDTLVQFSKDVEDESKEIEEKKVDTVVESEEKEAEVPSHHHRYHRRRSRKNLHEEEDGERKMHRRRSRKSLHGEGEEKEEGGHHHRYHRRRSRKNLHDEEGEDGDGERKMHRRRSRKSLHGEEEEKEEAPKNVVNEGIRRKTVQLPSFKETLTEESLVVVKRRRASIGTSSPSSFKSDLFPVRRRDGTENTAVNLRMMRMITQSQKQLFLKRARSSPQLNHAPVPRNDVESLELVLPVSEEAGKVAKIIEPSETESRPALNIVKSPPADTSKSGERPSLDSQTSSEESLVRLESVRRASVGTSKGNEFHAKTFELDEVKIPPFIRQRQMKFLGEMARRKQREEINRGSESNLGKLARLNSQQRVLNHVRASSTNGMNVPRASNALSAPTGGARKFFPDNGEEFEYNPTNEEGIVPGSPADEKARVFGRGTGQRSPSSALIDIVVTHDYDGELSPKISLEEERQLQRDRIKDKIEERKKKKKKVTLPQEEPTNEDLKGVELVWTRRHTDGPKSLVPDEDLLAFKSLGKPDMSSSKSAHERKRAATSGIVMTSKSLDDLNRSRNRSKSANFTSRVKPLQLPTPNWTKLQ